MHHFFTVDRRGLLKQEGQLLSVTHYDDIAFSLDGIETLYGNDPGKELQNHVDFLFPNGVTPHGEQYFLNSKKSPAFVHKAVNFLHSCGSLDQAKKDMHSTLSNSTMALIEILFEYVRRGCFPDKPSRFTSLFGWETLEQAQAFRKKYGKESMPIWKIQAEKFFRADMNLLSINLPSVLILSYSVHRYWAGLPAIHNSTPCWEILLPPPIKVLHQVQE